MNPRKKLSHPISFCARTASLSRRSALMFGVLVGFVNSGSASHCASAVLMTLCISCGVLSFVMINLQITLGHVKLIIDISFGIFRLLSNMHVVSSGSTHEKTLYIRS